MKTLMIIVFFQALVSQLLKSCNNVYTLIIYVVIPFFALSSNM